MITAMFIALILLVIAGVAAWVARALTATIVRDGLGQRPGPRSHGADEFTRPW